MNSAKLFKFVLFFALIAGASAHGEELASIPVPVDDIQKDGTFRITATAGFPENSPEEVTAIADLKKKAVVLWLQKMQLSQFENEVTPEIADKQFISYSSKRRVGSDRSQLQVDGQLDVDALKKWVNVSVVETKIKSTGALTPLLAVSSSIPNSAFTPQDAANRPNSGLIQALLTIFNATLQKYKFRLTPLEPRPFSLSLPARSEMEIETLKSQVNSGSHNTLLWAHFAPCPHCPPPGVRMDLFLYNLIIPRLIRVRTEDLALDPKELNNLERMKSVLKAPIQHFQVEFDEMISQGILFSNIFRLGIRKSSPTLPYSNITNELNKESFISQAALKYVRDAGYAEYEVLSPLSRGELYKRLKQTRFATSEIEFSLR